MEYYAIVLEKDGKTHIMRDGTGKLLIYDQESCAWIRRNSCVEYGVMVPEVKVKKVVVEV